MANIYEVDSERLINLAAKKLEESGIKKPEYVKYVKSGYGRERIPSQKNFWYIRCASILRQIYITAQLGSPNCDQIQQQA
jgi:SSU ribosomal protein S19E